ncbi:meckelin isoform X2 [Amia ocellicauda]|uniref:meckelin isoform X2 n=1 Tax=Amia ocellicauda TaxID=2972642 RepID=UPI0034640C4E
MASKSLFYLAFISFFPVYCVSQNTGTYFPFVQPTSCNQTAFFNSASFQCNVCGGNQHRSQSGLQCICNPGFNVTDLGSPIVKCSYCTGVVSLDQRRCLQCTNENCACTGAGQIQVGNMVDLTVTCTTCPQTTVGNPSGATCVLCQETFYYVTGNCSCLPTQLRGGLCFSDTSSSSSSDTEPRNSIWFQSYLESGFLACTIYNNQTACQLLTNMVILSPGGMNSKAYNLYKKASQTTPLPFLPQLFYSSDAALPLGQTAPRGLTFQRNTKINFKVVKFDASGHFLGWEDVTGGTLQLCPDTQKRLNAAYLFGTTYQQSCSVQVTELLRRFPEPVFYELFLQYQDSQGKAMVWPVPVRTLNQQTDTPGFSRDLRRFFLVDGLTGRSGSLTDQPQYVTYLSSLALSINMPTGTPGTLPPFQLTVEYSKVNDPSLSPAQILFAVTYSMNEATMKRDTTIAMGVLGALSVLLAMLETSSWSRRAGQQYITLSTIVKFIAFLIGNLGNTFFLVTFGTGIYWLIAFKGQRTTVDIALPSAGGTVEMDFKIYLYLAFAFKALQVIHVLVVQVTISIFFIDWEKPKNTTGGRSQGSSVSAWRMFFVANEWNEIQTMRKLNPLLQLFAVLLILQVIGVENIAARDLNLAVQPGVDNYLSPWSPILRYGITASVWLAVGLVQVLFFVVIYERVLEDKIRQFVDLCAMSNVSVFILMHRCYGFYIHGRSVHGHADVGIDAIRANLRKEEENLCALRGLEANSDIQTFEFLLTEKVRYQLDRIMLPLTEASGIMNRRAGAEGLQEQTMKAFHTMNRFLSSFFEHVHKDMDYIVKDKLLLERVMNYEFQQPIERSIFYNDHDGTVFSEVLYYSKEMTLLLFDTLLFCIINLGTQNLVLAAILTYVIQQGLQWVRYLISRWNLASKTLVDECFLI